MEVAVGSVHSCHTALSNYSTIAAARLMEFQLKYDSFRICFCWKERERGSVSWVGGPGCGRWGGSLAGDSLSVLCQKGMTYLRPLIQMHSAVRAWKKWGLSIKVFVTRSQKWSF